MCVLLLSVYIGCLHPKPAHANEDFDITLVLLVASIGVNILGFIAAGAYACVQSSRIFCNPEQGLSKGLCCLYLFCPCCSKWVQEPEAHRQRRHDVEDQLRAVYLDQGNEPLNRMLGYLNAIRDEDLPAAIAHLQQRQGQHGEDLDVDED